MNPFTLCPHCDLPLTKLGYCEDKECPIDFRQWKSETKHSLVFTVGGFCVITYYDEPRTDIYLDTMEGHPLYHLNRPMTWNWKDPQAMLEKIKIILVFS